MTTPAFYRDNVGNSVGVEYSTILTDPNFERRLKLFDPNLKLMFDQRVKKWTILEYAPDNSGWNILLRAENKDGTPKPLGEWVFNTLFVWRKRMEERLANPDAYFDSLIVQAHEQTQEIEDKISERHKEQLIDDRVSWRKAAREIRNLPSSDVTAGYRKIQPKHRGKKHESI